MLNQFSIKVINRFAPSLFWKMFLHKCGKLFDHSYLTLSFDCDTEEDIEVVEEVHSKLQKIGIAPVYAVPGELLQKGAKVYKKLYQSGAEFINHGGRSHTYFDEEKGRHASNFFYDQQSPEVVKEDILKGHQIIKEVLGFEPTGWRTPHFGTYQKKEHLDFLYKTLKELKYTFSTSTTPIFGYTKGPIYQEKGLYEIPVTGIFKEPLNILDTWAYFAAPDRIKTPKEYVLQLKVFSDICKRKALFINIYGDPSHIYDKLEFYQAMEILKKETLNINYGQLIEKINESIRHTA